MRAAMLLVAGFVVGLALGFFLWGGPARRAAFERRYANGARVRVLRVIDGDTIVLEDGMHLRYRGCDCPEVFKFARDPEPFAEEASHFNRKLVEGAWVRLSFPPASLPTIDSHGRILADVRLDSPDWAASETIAEILVREGLARVVPLDGDELLWSRLKDAEAKAKGESRGMWAGTIDRSPGFVAGRYGRMFHKPECIYARRMSGANILRFSDLEAALRSGKSPCPVCLGDGSNLPVVTEGEDLQEPPFTGGACGP